MKTAALFAATLLLIAGCVGASPQARHIRPPPAFDGPPDPTHRPPPQRPQIAPIQAGDTCS